MTRPRDDIPTSEGLAVGASGRDVESIQQYLGRFGYFDNGIHQRFGMTPEGAESPPKHPGEFCDCTQTALRKFQEINGLPMTGDLNAATLGAMGTERCGVPDVGDFVLHGNKWGTTNLRYGFNNFSGDITQTQIRNGIRTAINLWSAVTPLTFTEVPISSNPEIRIRFVTGDHGDGSSFDGGGGVLAHAFYPPPNAGPLAGDAHFDDAETWSVNLPPSGIDLITVAAHEFGHSLGLRHSSVTNALMFAFYGGPHRFLHQDDIDGIQALYGVEGWHSSKQIRRAFTSYHSKNAWALIQDVGWRKIKPSNNDGVTNTFAAVCEARANGKTATVQVSNTELFQIYV